jgi:hypothetical protein
MGPFFLLCFEFPAIVPAGGAPAPKPMRRLAPPRQVCWMGAHPPGPSSREQKAGNLKPARSVPAWGSDWKLPSAHPIASPAKRRLES